MKHCNRRTISTTITLLRAKQWYKNLVIFLPILFAKQITDVPYLVSTLLGFAALSLTSSAGYIINDIIDRKKDAEHPIKKHRPIASGAIRAKSALTISGSLLTGSTIVSLSLSEPFAVINIALFLMILLYSLFFRNELFADIIAISTNFVLRSVAGAFTLSKGVEAYVPVSPWLLICTFFLALFLASAKRNAEATMKSSLQNRSTLTGYTKHISYFLLTLSSSLLIISYSFYIFFTEHHLLFVTIPISTYTILRYAHLTETRPELCVETEKSLKDRKLLISASVWTLTTLALFYIQ